MTPDMLLCDLSCYFENENTRWMMMQENKKEKSKSLYKILWDTWDKFWQHTTISGVSNAGGSSSGLRRYIWMILFALFASFTFVGLKNNISDYIRYPVMTSVTVRHQNQVQKYICRISRTRNYDIVLDFSII